LDYVQPLSIPLTIRSMTLVKAEGVLMIINYLGILEIIYCRLRKIPLKI